MNFANAVDIFLNINTASSQGQSLLKPGLNKPEGYAAESAMASSKLRPPSQSQGTQQSTHVLYLARQTKPVNSHPTDQASKQTTEARTDQTTGQETNQGLDPHTKQTTSRWPSRQRSHY
jgi:hypothetical protein